MLPTLRSFLAFVHIAALVSLSLYGLHSLVLTGLYLLHRHDPLPLPPAPAHWPLVTVQLPLYNERYTAPRVLSAIAALDYPRDRLEIQALDDSTDDTRQLVAQAIARLQQAGFAAAHITRSVRTGYKAGAQGDLVAIFDADACPPPDFLRRVVPHLLAPHTGCIQTRWGHLNRSYALLTRLQALGIDGHFVVEQTARSRAGLFLHFNGTAGIWRRDCIEQAGGWLGNTLTEDLDLSVRAQLCGWRIGYLPDVIVPAELPAQFSSLKRQQARWAQGTTQTALKMIGPLGIGYAGSGAAGTAPGQ